ncbi:MAG: spermidine synthase [Elusimicrobiota bacterium]
MTDSIRPSVKASIFIFLCALTLAPGMRGLMDRVWINRLNAAYPGGRILSLARGPGEDVAIYRFSSGASVLLRNGVASYASADCAKLEVNLPILLDEHAFEGPADGASSRKYSTAHILLLEIRNPLSLAAGLSSGATVDWVDPNPGIKKIIVSQNPEILRLTSNRLRMKIENPKNFLRSSPNRYDVIVFDLPAPLSSPQAAFDASLQTLRMMRRRLTPGGILLLRVPLPYFSDALARLANAVKRRFAAAAILQTPGCLFLVAGQKPLIPRIDSLADLPTLPETGIRSGMLEWIYPGDADWPALQKSMVQDPIGNAFPLPDILRGETPSYGIMAEVSPASHFTP